MSTTAGEHNSTESNDIVEHERSSSSDSMRRNGISQASAAGQLVDTHQFTFRAVCAGLSVGTIVNFSNMYFGLQSKLFESLRYSLQTYNADESFLSLAGWVSMMSMPASLIGFAIFKSLDARLAFPFTPVENGDCTGFKE